MGEGLEIMANNQTSNVLITGGAGFIGSNLACSLVERGYKVTVLDNLSPQIHGDDPLNSTLFLNIKNKVEFIRGDVSNRDDWETSLKGQDIVIHLAAETGTGQSMYEIEKYVDVNIKGTSILMDILTNDKTEVKKVIIASSRAVYGEGKYFCEQHGNVYPIARSDENMLKGDFLCKCPVCDNMVKLLATDEESFSHPTSVYGYTKKVQEEMCLLIGQAIGIPVVAFRFQNVYGPGQSLKNPYTGILSIFSTRIKNGQDINIFEDGKESRDFVYIDDVVNAIILGMKKNTADFQVFNVGAGVPTDVLKIADLLKKFYKSDTLLKISGNYRVGDIRHCYADLSKIEKLLGYFPQYDIAQGMKKFAQWVDGQAVEKDQYDKSIQEMKERGLFK